MLPYPAWCYPCGYGSSEMLTPARAGLAGPSAGPASRTGAVTLLLNALREAGARDAARTLAALAANAGMFHLVVDTYPDEAARYPSGRVPDGTPSPPWRWQEPGGPSGPAT